MKKLLTICLLATGVILLSCGKGGGLSAKAKKNKEVNSAIMKAYEAGDFSKMGDYIAADAIDHGGETGDLKGLESIVGQMKIYRESMPDMKMSMIHEMADDEYVMTWASVSGTMNGKQTKMTSLDVSKFKDGKAVEHWVFMDPREMMQMMQTMPGMGMGSDTTHAPVADTTNH